MGTCMREAILSAVGDIFSGTFSLLNSSSKIEHGNRALGVTMEQNDVTC